MEKATIFDFARFCGACDNCIFCPLSSLKNGTNAQCTEFIESYTAKANEIILKWCKEHPIKTRQSEFLKMFPNARMHDNDFIDICPCYIDERLSNQMNCAGGHCLKCRKDYWLAEVEENDR